MCNPRAWPPCTANSIPGPDMTQESPVKTVITCHANADFDALASMIAVSKLYP